MSVTDSAGHSGHHGAGHRGRRRGPLEECRCAVLASACGLFIGAGEKSIREIQDLSGAQVRKDEYPSPTPGFEIFIIRGTRPQIMKAVKLIYNKAGIDNLLAKKVQDFWIRWVEHVYPNLETQAHFLPAAHINRVPMRKRNISGADVHVLERISTYFRRDTILTTTRVQETDMVIDAAVGRVVFCLQKMAEKNKDEVFMAISQMNFGDYLGEPCYMPVAAFFPNPSNLPEYLPRNWRQGSFDLLIIHRHYGIIVCEIKASGDSEQTYSQAESEFIRIAKKLRKSVSQLDKAEAMLSYLVSDVAPGLSITKTIALPNLTSGQIQEVINADPELAQELHRCLNTDDITGVCICFDQLSSPSTPWDIANDVLWRLRKWWEQCVISSGMDPVMSSNIYKTLVARFCGPATSVKVPCLSEPRLCVKTVGQAVSETGKRYALITLFPEQVDLLSSPPPRVFLAGPPGTGKTVVLVLIAMHWLKCGNDVYVLSTWINSRIVCSMLYHLLQQWLSDQGESSQPMGKVHFIHFNFRGGKETDQAFDYLKVAAGDSTSVYVIADEIGPDDLWSPDQDYPFVCSEHLWKFCHRLLQEVPDLHFWAANCKHGVARPDDWQVETFTRPLRSPPTVVKEVELSEELGGDVAAYTERGVPDHTHGPPVKFVYHYGPSHNEEHPRNCVQCGKVVGSFIRSLGVGQTDASSNLCEALAGVAPASVPTTSAARPPALQFRDVLVLCVGHVGDNSGVVAGLRSVDIPVKVMESKEDMEDVATARSDVVWVSYGNVARGIERKVVVCVRDDYHDADKYNRLYPLSRCMAQLVLVLPASPVVPTMSVTDSAGHSGRHGAEHRCHQRGPPEECRCAVPASACGLVIGRKGQSIREIQELSGARVWKDDYQSLSTKMEIFVIHGTRPQIMKAVKIIYHKAGIYNLLAEEAQAFWIEWVEHNYPDLETQAHFMPAAHINRVPMRKRKISGAHVHVLERIATTVKRDSTFPTSNVQETDMAIDAAVGRVVFCLQKMAEKNKEEVFMVISQLNFGDYIGEPCYIPVTALLPHPSNLPEYLPQNWRQGSFDLLIIHRHYGIIVCEIEALGDSEQTYSQPESDSIRIGETLRKSVSQLDKAEAMLSYLVSDVAPGLSITKTIALPNLTSDQVQQVIRAHPELAQDLRRCLNTDDITGVCICSDQLSSPRTPWDLTNVLLWRLRKWWEQCVISSGVDPLMSSNVYKTLVARFCGPATSVKVPCLSEPRLCVKTVGQAVSETGKRYALITLFPEQVDLLSSPPPRVFLAGPPGTGKTVVLVLIAMRWLKCGNDVYVLSTWINSRIVCRMLYHLLQQWLSDQGESSQPMGKVHFIHFNFRGGKETDQAFDYLKKAAGDSTSVYVIADEVGPDDLWSPDQDYPFVWSQHLWKFCHRLLQEVPDLHFWAANCKHGVAPPDEWQVETFTRPLRSPPTVVKEVELSEELGGEVPAYTERGVPDHTHGPPVKFVYHHGPSHDEEHPRNCVQCGKDIGSFIRSLGVGQTDDSSNLCEELAVVASSTGSFSVGCPPALQFKDMLVLCLGHVDSNSGVVAGLRSADIPVKVMKSKEDMEDVATARSDVVWVSYGNVARGIERKVVVCVRDDYHDADKYNRLYPLSRCMAQLVLVLPASPGEQI